MTVPNTKSCLLKGISLFVAVAFTATTITVSPSTALASTGTFDFLGQSKAKNELQQYLFALPAEIGTITKINQVSGPRPKVFENDKPVVDRGPGFEDRFVVLIQDAHANPEAEQNIAGILKYLEKKFPDMSVGLEGAKGQLHPEYFEFFKDFPEADQAVIDDLRQKGELNGVELYLWDKQKGGLGIRDSGLEITRNQNESQGARYESRVFGVEDINLYRDNLKTFRELLSSRDEIQTLLNPLCTQLEKESSKVLNPELRDFLKERDRRKDGKFSLSQVTGDPDLQAYVRYLKTQSSKILKIDLTDMIEQLRFPNLIRVIYAEEEQKGFDIEAAKKQWESVLAALTASAKKKSEQEFVKALGSYAREQGFVAQREGEQFSYPIDRALYPRKLLEGLMLFIKSHPIDLKAYEQFMKSWRLLVFRSEIDVTGVMQEMSSLEENILGKLAKTEAEKKLIEHAEDLNSLTKLLHLELTRPEYEQVLARREAVEKLIQGPQSQFQSIEAKRKLGQSRLPSDKENQKSGQTRDKRLETRDSSLKSQVPASPEGGSGLQSFFETALHFYDVSIQRDRALLENALNLAEGGITKTPSSILHPLSRIVVLVTGGFHTSGVEELLKNEGIGYAVITPRIHAVDHGERYQKVMAGDNADLSAYFKVKNPFTTKQEAIIFKQLLETAAPALFEKYQASPADIISKVKQVVESHPVLSKSVAVQMANQDKASALRFFPRSDSQASIPQNAAVIAPCLTMLNTFYRESTVKQESAASFASGPAVWVLNKTDALQATIVPSSATADSTNVNIVPSSLNEPQTFDLSKKVFFEYGTLPPASNPEMPRPELVGAGRSETRGKQAKSIVTITGKEPLRVSSRAETRAAGTDFDVWFFNGSDGLSSVKDMVNKILKGNGLVRESLKELQKEIVEIVDKILKGNELVREGLKESQKEIVAKILKDNGLARESLEELQNEVMDEILKNNELVRAGLKELQIVVYDKKGGSVGEKGPYTENEQLNKVSRVHVTATTQDGANVDIEIRPLPSPSRNVRFELISVLKARGLTNSEIPEALARVDVQLLDRWNRPPRSSSSQIFSAALTKADAELLKRSDKMPRVISMQTGSVWEESLTGIVRRIKVFHSKAPSFSDIPKSMTVRFMETVQEMAKLPWGSEEWGRIRVLNPIDIKDTTNVVIVTPYTGLVLDEVLEKAITHDQKFVLQNEGGSNHFHDVYDFPGQTVPVYVVVFKVKSSGSALELKKEQIEKMRKNVSDAIRQEVEEQHLKSTERIAPRHNGHPDIFRNEHDYFRLWTMLRLLRTTLLRNFTNSCLSFFLWLIISIPAAHFAAVTMTLERLLLLFYHIYRIVGESHRAEGDSTRIRIYDPPGASHTKFVIATEYQLEIGPEDVIDRLLQEVLEAEVPGCVILRSYGNLHRERNRRQEEVIFRALEVALNGRPLNLRQGQRARIEAKLREAIQAARVPDPAAHQKAATVPVSPAPGFVGSSGGRAEMRGDGWTRYGFLAVIAAAGAGLTLLSAVMGLAWIKAFLSEGLSQVIDGVRMVSHPEVRRELFDGFGVLAVIFSMAVAGIKAIERTPAQKRVNRHVEQHWTLLSVLRTAFGHRAEMRNYTDVIKTILVVEDDLGPRETIRQILRAKGYDEQKRGEKIVLANSAKEAMTIIERRKFDAAIIDYKMPEMNGVQLVEKFREKGINIPIMMVTASANVGDERSKIEAKLQGADVVYKIIGKPYDTDEILAALQELADRSTAEVSVVGAPARAEMRVEEAVAEDMPRIMESIAFLKGFSDPYGYKEVSAEMEKLKNLKTIQLLLWEKVGVFSIFSMVNAKILEQMNTELDQKIREHLSDSFNITTPAEWMLHLILQGYWHTIFEILEMKQGKRENYLSLVVETNLLYRKLKRKDSPQVAKERFEKIMRQSKGSVIPYGQLSVVTDSPTIKGLMAGLKWALFDSKAAVTKMHELAEWLEVEIQTLRDKGILKNDGSLNIEENPEERPGVLIIDNLDAIERIGREISIRFGDSGPGRFVTKDLIAEIIQGTLRCGSPLNLYDIMALAYVMLNAGVMKDKLATEDGTGISDNSKKDLQDAIKRILNIIKMLRTLKKIQLFKIPQKEGQIFLSLVNWDAPPSEEETMEHDAYRAEQIGKVGDAEPIEKSEQEIAKRPIGSLDVKGTAFSVVPADPESHIAYDIVADNGVKVGRFIYMLAAKELVNIEVSNMSNEQEVSITEAVIRKILDISQGHLKISDIEGPQMAHALARVAKERELNVSFSAMLRDSAGDTSRRNLNPNEVSQWKDFQVFQKNEKTFRTRFPDPVAQIVRGNNGIEIVRLYSGLKKILTEESFRVSEDGEVRLVGESADLFEIAYIGEDVITATIAPEASEYSPVIKPESPKPQGQKVESGANSEQIRIRGKVVIAEDEPSVRRILVRVLARIMDIPVGREEEFILEAVNGQDALKIIKKDPDSIGLLITDISMSPMSGDELIKAVWDLQKIRGKPMLPVIVSSGYGTSLSKPVAIIGEDPDFSPSILPKPYSVSDLRAAIKAALETSVTSSRSEMRGDGEVMVVEEKAPVAKDASAAQAIDALIVSAKIRLDGKSVLVVDDDSVSRMLEKARLENLGAKEVVIAESGDEALALFQQAIRDNKPFDLILTDVQMPEKNGPQWIEEAKKAYDGGLGSQGSKNFPPIIFATADDMATFEANRETLEGQGVKFQAIEKPVTRQVMAEAVVDVFSRTKIKIQKSVFKNIQAILNHLPESYEGRELLETVLNSLAGENPDVNQAVRALGQFQESLKEEPVPSEYSIGIKEILEDVKRSLEELSNEPAQKPAPSVLIKRSHSSQGEWLSEDKVRELAQRFEFQHPESREYERDINLVKAVLQGLRAGPNSEFSIEERANFVINDTNRFMQQLHEHLDLPHLQRIGRILTKGKEADLELEDVGSLDWQNGLKQSLSSLEFYFTKSERYLLTNGNENLVMDIMGRAYARKRAGVKPMRSELRGFEVTQALLVSTLGFKRELLSNTVPNEQLPIDELMLQAIDSTAVELGNIFSEEGLGRYASGWSKAQIHAWIANLLLEPLRAMVREQSSSISNEKLATVLEGLKQFALNGQAVESDIFASGPELHINITDLAAGQWDALKPNLTFVSDAVAAFHAKIVISMDVDDKTAQDRGTELRELARADGVELGKDQLKIVPVRGGNSFPLLTKGKTVDVLMARVDEKLGQRSRARARSYWVTDDANDMKTLTTSILTALLYSLSDKNAFNPGIQHSKDHQTLLEASINAILSYKEIQAAA